MSRAEREDIRLDMEIELMLLLRLTPAERLESDLLGAAELIDRARKYLREKVLPALRELDSPHADDAARALSHADAAWQALSPMFEERDP